KKNHNNYYQILLLKLQINLNNQQMFLFIFLTPSCHILKDSKLFQIHTQIEKDSLIEKYDKFNIEIKLKVSKMSEFEKKLLHVQLHADIYKEQNKNQTRKQAKLITFKKNEKSKPRKKKKRTKQQQTRNTKRYFDFYQNKTFE
ncbi:hypothetical protein IMG5_190060, partial [Ichthyophthirius multifiliis]